MFVLEHDLRIERRIEEVFARSADPRHWPRWRSELDEVVPLADGELGLGATYRIKGHAGGRTVEMTGAIVAYEPYTHVGFRTTSGPLHVELDLRFEPDGDATRLHLQARMEPGGVLRLAEGLLARQAEAVWLENLVQLKQYLESEP
jgi:uncharacterized protein YndB with AHSA1/START domain